MKHPMHEAIQKKHDLHIKITVEPASKDAPMSEPMEGAPAEEMAESPEVEAKEKAAGLDSLLTSGMRDEDEEQMLAKKPQGLHERVVKHALMKKKGK